MNALSSLLSPNIKALRMAEGSNVLYMNPLFMIQNSLKSKAHKAHKVMNNGTEESKVSMALVEKLQEAKNSPQNDELSVVNELPSHLIKALMKIAETCVIKSNRISRDETPDFVQNCLLKLLLQVEQQRVAVNSDKSQYFVIKKDGKPLEIERWFGTAATNISIDRYRRLKNQVEGLEINQTTPSHEETPSLLVVEPSTNLEQEMRETKIQEMAQYCAAALDDCMDDTWMSISEDNYKNFTLEFAHYAHHNNKGVAVANYCRIVLEDKYNNDGKKTHNHDSVCQDLGIIIRPENISHKKKKFEQLMLKCIAQKVDVEFNRSTKELLQDDITGEH